MTDHNNLIDRTALLRNRTRYEVGRGSFLHDEAISEVQHRLTLINKSFTDIAIVTPQPDLWQTAFPDAMILDDEDVLEFGDRHFDLILHVMALHWSNDPVGQMIQSLRVLRPDGLFLGCLLGGETLRELRSAFAIAESTVTGGLSPRVLPMADIRDLGALLQRAGFALPVSDSVKLATNYKTPLHLMKDLRAMGESNAQRARQKSFTRRAVFEEMIKLYGAHYSIDEHRVAATFEIMWLTGWAPSESQPKPLRPGSAKLRLSEALRVEEKSLKD